MPGGTIHVLVAARDEVIGEGVSRVLASQPGTAVVALRPLDDELGGALAASRPEVVVAALDPDPFDAAAVLRDVARVPGAPPIVAIASRLRVVLPEVLAAGACAAVSPTVAADLLRRAVEVAAAGGSFFSRDALDEVARLLGGDRSAARVLDDDLEILRLVSEGLSNREIAARAYRSEASVKRALGRAMRALGAARRADAVIVAMERGLLS